VFILGQAPGVWSRPLPAPPRREELGICHYSLSQSGVVLPKGVGPSGRLGIKQAVI
jgi:hypothetical protein